MTTPQLPGADAMATLAVLPAAAREAIAARLEGRPPQDVPDPIGVLAHPWPAFVTLRTRGELRGCIGELEAGHADLVAEVMDRALAAAGEDPRFVPIRAEELAHTTVEVTLIGPLEPVATMSELDPARYGVEVSDGRGRRGVLLPGIAGVDGAAQQVEIACSKAGIPAAAPVALRRFEALKICEAP